MSNAFGLTLSAIAIAVLLAFGLFHQELFPEPGPVNSRAPGLSEHASPFGKTEARAERTIERPPDK